MILSTPNGIEYILLFKRFLLNAFDSMSIFKNVNMVAIYLILTMTTNEIMCLVYFVIITCSINVIIVNKNPFVAYLNLGSVFLEFVN